MPQDLKAGMVSFKGLVPKFGITGSDGVSEKQTGLMTVSSLNDWLGRLSNSIFATSGPTGDWQGEWFGVWNYLQYGGSCFVGGTGSTGSFYNVDLLTNSPLHNKNVVELDVIFDGGNTFSSGAAINAATTRTDCMAIVGNYRDIATLSMSSNYDGFTADFGQKTLSKYVTYVAGRKKFTYLNSGVATVYDGGISSDVAGCFARTAETNNIWISPAGYTNGRILNVLYLTQKFSDSDISYFTAGGVNPINSIPGQGTFFLSNITSYPVSGTSQSIINSMMLALYIKKQLTTTLKQYLFEINDAITRLQVVNSATPIMNGILANNGIASYSLICDESNNTQAVRAAGNLILDVVVDLVYPVSTITIRVTNSATGEVLVS